MSEAGSAAEPIRWRRIGRDIAARTLAGLLTGKRASRAAYLGMDQILPPELNDLEFEALRQLAAHPTTCHIPSGIESRLKDIGYAKESWAASS
jgi:hypothetical protein